MLNKLLIKNVALIESADISFTKGLNVLSGETGAGKSVIIESLNFCLGAKADKSLIRTGSKEAVVSAEFEVSDNTSVLLALDELGIEKEDILLISRKINSDGKNTARVNGETVTVGMLKKITSGLVDVHGQSEHFQLLSVSNQLKLIDKFGGEELAKIKNTAAEEYASFKAKLSEYSSLGGDENQRLIRLDVLNYQISEIKSCDLKNNEEEELLAVRERLLHREKLASALSLVKEAIDGEGGVDDILGNASRAISGISELGKDYSELSERLSTVYSEIDDISAVAGSLYDNLDSEEFNLDEIEERLNTIKKIKKKYGNSYEEINIFLSEAEKEKEKLENFNELSENLSVEIGKIKISLYNIYKKLNIIRKKYAEIFSNNVVKELRELNMNKAAFNVNFVDFPDFENCMFDSANGVDSIEFMFSANLGEPLKPLSAVISGGEMSRFMLSIKAQSAKYNDISTFIFDEIDAGISGTVARVVAEKLCRISRGAQVIAISHLPQITSFADNNLLIKKAEVGNLTFTTVKTLSESEKINEITRLVGGSAENQSAKTLAVELLTSASEYKKTL